nr:MAG TPA: hypothetical protein [Caudoviricetes sp.]
MLFIFHIEYIICVVQYQSNNVGKNFLLPSLSVLFYEQRKMGSPP